MGAEIPKRFNLIRWFSLVSFAVITTVVISLTILSTRFLLIENVRRDGLLTAQAVHAIAAMERYHAAPGMAMPMEAGLVGPGQEGSASGGCRRRSGGASSSSMSSIFPMYSWPACTAPTGSSSGRAIRN
ncbi:hypothetical protein ACFSHR_04210 [Azotobacter chroococcum]